MGSVFLPEVNGLYCIYSTSVDGFLFIPYLEKLVCSVFLTWSILIICFVFHTRCTVDGLLLFLTWSRWFVVYNLPGVVDLLFLTCSRWFLVYTYPGFVVYF